MLCLYFSDARLQGCVDLSADVGILLEHTHGFPETHLFGLDGRVVLAQFILTVIQGLENGVELALGRLILVKVVAQPVTKGNKAEQLLC